MPTTRRRSLKRALQAALIVAALFPVGCGASRPGVLAGQGEAPPSGLGRLVVGEPVLDEILSYARSANLVICVIDAARADHVGCYGYPRETTPNIDQLAKESVVFRNHFSPFPATKLATASLLTGLYPDPSLPLEQQTTGKAAFTLERGLGAAGFRTAFFSSSVAASPETGIGAGFEQVFARLSTRGRTRTQRISLPEEALWRTPEGLTGVLARWLAQEGQSRFFAYCHFLPPHNPCEAPEALKRLFADADPPAVPQGGLEFPEVRPPYGRFRPLPPQQWVNLYDANMRWADWGVGEVVRLLREYGVLDNTLLVVTSDHGEAFGEHGYIYHSHAVYDEFLHVPLLIRFPGQRRLVGEVAALTQTLDLLPTIFDLYGIPYPRDAVHGSSLLPQLGREKGRGRDYVFATCADPCRSYLARDTEWSFMLYPGRELRALYDLRTDPAQTHNVVEQHEDVAARMTAALEGFARAQGRSLDQLLAAPAAGSSASRAPGSGLPEETRRELRALGYVY